MRCYLPADVDVVVEGSDGSYGWLTLAREVDVTGYKKTRCPLRGRVEVLTVTTNGVQIWFLESQVKVELPAGMLETVQATFPKVVKLEYDVPSIVSQNPTEYRDSEGNSFKHPSTWMWGIGARTSKSVWILPADRIPYTRIRNLIRAGCNYDVTYLDSTDVANQLQRTVVTLRNEWLDSIESHKEAIQRAKDKATQEGNTEGVLIVLNGDFKRIDRELKRKQENIKYGANLFGVPMDWVSEGVASLQQVTAVGTLSLTQNLQQQRRGRKRRFDERVAAHAAAVAALVNAGETGMASALEGGTIPHGIVADYIEEKELADGDTTFSLRDSFKEE